MIKEATMKKLLGKMMTFISVAAMFAFISCGEVDDSSSDDSEKTKIDNSPTSYANLSYGRTYIGGALVYNPSDPIKNNQLEPGTLIAVREGSIDLVTKTMDVYELPEGATERKHYNTSDVEGETSDLTKTTRTITVYEDKAENARYGYIKITSVDKESISFSYTRYNLKGTGSTTKSYSIKKDEVIDINGDNKVDLTYRDPDALREGFEDSCWFEFICNPDEEEEETPASTSTMMFSVISNTSASDRSLVRAADGTVAKQADYGLYGVNTNGNYIFILKDNGLVNTNGGSLSNTINDYELKYGDYVILQNEGLASTTNADEPDSESAQSYVVSFSDESGSRTTLNNSSFSNVYNYKIRQFQSEQGPKDLLKRMPVDVLKLIDAELTVEKVTTDTAYDSTKCLEVLNAILSKGSAVSDILLDKDNKLAGNGRLAVLKKSINGKTIDKKTLRELIDSIFPQSPKAALAAPSIEAMYPYLSLNLGESVYKEAEEEYFDVSGSAARMADNVKDYKEKKKAIDKKFEEYFAIELKKVTYGTKKDKDGNVEKDKDGNDKKNEYKLKDYGVKLALGVKGSLSINAGWDGSARAGLGGVIYLDVGLSLLESTFDKIKEPLEKMLKTEFKNTVMIGAVPVTVGAKLGFGLDLELETEDDKPIDLAFCFVGMYGAGINAGVNWGTHWMVPYLNFSASPYKVSETEWYFGAASGDISDYKDLLNPLTPIKATLTPKLTVEPLVGLGPKWVNFNVSVPITPQIPLTFRIRPIEMAMPVAPELLKVALGLEVKFKASIDVTILVFDVSHSFIDKKIIDWTGKNAFVLWEKEEEKK